MATEDAAVRIATDVLAERGYGPDLPSDFYAVLDALTEHGWLRDPTEGVELRAAVRTLVAHAERSTRHHANVYREDVERLAALVGVDW